ncbi:hypothetical protein EVJ58_g4710 [Rhodofomes roseus]|uniref:Uncharacterized protein n=1 Tax=Rhodofomes roseus TaxID=34475 RepID=A0A4Y9YI30_9APHY|nr:hypothetical protein EVJ58_g4710 [Rhodofomes roseus]
MCGVTFAMVSSSPEVVQKMNCYDAALNATRAAVKEGMLPGDDVAPLKASLVLWLAGNNLARREDCPDGQLRPDL